MQTLLFQQPAARERCKLPWFQQPEARERCKLRGAAAVADAAAAADGPTAAATGYTYFSYSQPRHSDAQT